MLPRTLYFTMWGKATKREEFDRKKVLCLHAVSSDKLEKLARLSRPCFVFSIFELNWIEFPVTLFPYICIYNSIFADSKIHRLLVLQLIHTILRPWCGPIHQRYRTSHPRSIWKSEAKATRNERWRRLAGWLETTLHTIACSVVYGGVKREGRLCKD